jgi:hypothetical protein
MSLGCDPGAALTGWSARGSNQGSDTPRSKKRQPTAISSAITTAKKTQP